LGQIPGVEVKNGQYLSSPIKRIVCSGGPGAAAVFSSAWTVKATKRWGCEKRPKEKERQ
jgi:hypothetical protein